jgi:hypothetical protein
MRKKDEFSYDGEVGRWWLKKSRDGPHRRAYRRIADFVRGSFVRDPGLIVDYACGPGDLLSLLSVRFPRSRLVGLDGSRVMLQFARRRLALLPQSCAERIRLIETALPGRSVLKVKADLAVYCFPNMVSFDERGQPRPAGSWMTSNERKVAESLSRDGVSEDAHAYRRGLEQGRRVSLNLRRLLVRGGICVRIEYATMRRHELSPAELLSVSFEEGCLDHRVDGRKARQWFRFVASAYFRSGVLGDVFEQTGDERDKNGGYLITVLRAI